MPGTRCHADVHVIAPWSRSNLQFLADLGLDSFATWKEVAAVYHEGVPGHHLQISQSLTEQEQLNRWQRPMA